MKKRIVPEQHNEQRFTLRLFMNNILRALNLEKGILYTIWNLLIRPGKVLKNFLFEDRAKMMKPFNFALLLVSISTFVTFNFVDYGEFGKGLESGVQLSMDDSKKRDSLLQDSITRTIEITSDTLVTNDSIPSVDSLSNKKISPEDLHKKKKKKLSSKEFTEMMMTGFYESFSLITFLSIPFLALGSFLFFRSTGLNYSEHLVVNTFITGLMAVLNTLTVPLYSYDINFGVSVGMIITIAYNFFAYYKLFKYPMLETLFRTFFVLIFYYFFFFVVAAIFLLLRLYYLMTFTDIVL